MRAAPIRPARGPRPWRWLVLLALALAGCGAPQPEAVTATRVEGVVFSGFTGDIALAGDGRIDTVGQLSGVPLQVTVTESRSASPMAQVPVEFLVFDQQARLLSEQREAGRHLVRTDRDGRAVVYLRAPKKMAHLTIRVQVSDPEGGAVVLERNVLRYAIDPTELFFRFIGGLAIFLFGMKLMTSALQAIAGERLRNVLEALTRHRVVGLLAGALITMFIQSSSATTVMTVGLVNAGLLTLHQAVPVMFGANIGTTITAQIIAFKISKYAFPMLFLGLLGLLIGPSRRWRHGGEVVFGLGMLFLGMDLMGSVFKPLSTSAEFRSVFVAFSTAPYLGVLAGTVVTVLVQSSSATVGLTLILAEAGFVDFKGGFALILGDNIGTTITALLAALSARAAARRTAVVHTLFNVVGAGIMLALLYVPWDGQPVYLQLINRMTPGDVFAAEPVAIERHIANSHAFFNIAFAFLFLPASGAFADLATRLIPGDEKPARPTHLAPALLDTPSVALRSSQLEMAAMAALVQQMFAKAMRGFLEGPDDALDEVARDEFETDRMREEISNYLVRISEYELESGDAERIPRFLHIVNDLERFGDLTNEMAALARRRHDKALPFSEQALAEVAELRGALEGMLEETVELLKTGAIDHSWAVKAAEAEVDRLEDRFRKNHIKRLQGGGCDVIAGIVFLDLLTVMEKQGDFLHNVAVALGDDSSGPG